MEKLKNVNTGLRKLRVIYIAASTVLVMFALGIVAIYDSQESCSIKTTTQTESGYYKSGPQNWNNSRYEYQVPVTKSTCSTRADNGQSTLPIIIFIVLFLVVCYVLLPRLDGYLTLGQNRKS